MTTDPARVVGPRQRRRRVALSARSRILLWVMFAMVIALGTVGVILSAVLTDRVEAGAVRSIEQEIREFSQFAQVGTDPVSGQPFSSSQDLLRVHLQGQYPDENELMFGYTDRLIRQARSVPNDPVADHAVVSAIITSAERSGTVDTAAGDMIWGKQIAQLADGQTPGIFVVGHLLDPRRSDVQGTIQLISIISLVALISSSLVAWLVAGRILEPIRLVRQTAAEITEKRLKRRIPVRGKDDIAELSISFNDMLDRLDSAFAAQQKFVDDAGHELRTPITIVRGQLEVMSDDPADRAETMHIVMDELDRMNRIVDDLLVLARAEQPDFLQPKQVQLAELTTAVDIKVRALGDRHWVLESIGEGMVLLDAQRITQAVVQLAQNAVQHTEIGDAIRIGSVIKQGVVSWWVTDCGPGVPPEDLDLIFERFSRGSSGGARGHVAGAGLGLSIVRAIAAAHGGQVWVINNPSGGATFGLDLPLQVAAVEHPQKDLK